MFSSCVTPVDFEMMSASDKLMNAPYTKEKEIEIEIGPTGENK